MSRLKDGPSNLEVPTSPSPYESIPLQYRSSGFPGTLPWRLAAVGALWIRVPDQTSAKKCYDTSECSVLGRRIKYRNFIPLHWSRLRQRLLSPPFHLGMHKPQPESMAGSRIQKACLVLESLGILEGEAQNELLGLQ